MKDMKNIKIFKPQFKPFNCCSSYVLIFNFIQFYKLLPIILMHYWMLLLDFKLTSKIQMAFSKSNDLVFGKIPDNRDTAQSLYNSLAYSNIRLQLEKHFQNNRLQENPLRKRLKSYANQLYKDCTVSFTSVMDQFCLE